MASSAIKTGNISARYAAIVTTDATTGMATITFPKGLFSSAPVVTANGVSSDGRDVVVTLYGAPTATSCVVLARKSRVLPALASLLASYDVFAPVSVPVHLVARAAS